MLLNHEYMQSFSVKIDSRIQDLQTITRYLENKCQQDGTVFVYGRGKRKSKNQHLVTAEFSCPPQPGNLQRLVVESVIQVENPPPSQHFVHQHTVTGDNGRRHGIRRNGERREQEHLRQQPYSRHTQKSHRQVQKPVNRHRQVFLGLLLHHPFFLPTVPLAHPLISGPFMTPDLST